MTSFKNYKNVIKLGGEYYFNLEKALQFFNNCKKQNIAILGIECIKFDGKHIIPRSDLIADYSETIEEKRWKTVVEKSNNSARYFFTLIPKNEDILINFVLLTKEGWQEIKRKKIKNISTVKVP